MKKIDWGTSLSSQEEFSKLLNKSLELTWYESYYYQLRYKVIDFLYEVKMKYQVLTRGYSDRNWYAMCDELAALNIKLLTELRDNGHGHPSDLTEKSWKRTLNKMIVAFEIVSEEKWYLSKKEQAENEKKFKEGMELYVKYYRSLWD